MGGCGFIGLSSLLLPRAQSSNQMRLVLWTTATGFVASFFFVFETFFMNDFGMNIEDIDPIVCQIQALGIQFFNLALCLWVSVIAYSSYLMIIKGKIEVIHYFSFSNSKRKQIVLLHHMFFFACFLMAIFSFLHISRGFMRSCGKSLIICIILSFGDHFGPTIVWCWIKEDVNP
eukprot:TRINITY_DN5294_c0_g1_i3.p1 TRINITY_DN5294_c0_g1~~TRINITY_DN5294_c0_g1_i3.p1  ORF type:complete len:174 (-),score=31.16 TRINITY_DN5294_c0_g1_i3:736-1257(-)